MEETSNPTVLRDLDLVEVALVPEEEAFEGCVVGCPVEIDPTQYHTEGASTSPSTFSEREDR